ncbi:hypothetical protein SEA_BONES_89 [Mycobacterium phage Bones]|nr:hypothetical protein SEA_BONES_89 [Mycobacterium phage Bones]
MRLGIDGAPHRRGWLGFGIELTFRDRSSRSNVDRIDGSGSSSSDASAFGVRSRGG